MMAAGNTRRHTGGARGAAVVEFAITTGVLALILMWSHFFFDLIQIRMKVLEESRTALWEFTAVPLSDYDKGKQADHDNLFNTAKDEVDKDIKELYEKDLDSAYKYKTAKKATQRLTIDTIKVDDVKLTNSSALALQGLNLIESLLQGLKMDSFNRKGFVESDANADLKSSWVPTQVSFGKEWRVTPINKKLEQKLYMLVDSWKLEDGCSVETPGTYVSGGTGACAAKTGNSLMYKEVDRINNPLTSGINVNFSGASGALGDTGYPLATRVSSYNFRDQTEDGRQKLTVDGGEANYYSGAFCDERGGTGCQGPYQTAFAIRGQYFLGCMKEEYDGKELCPWDKNQPQPGP